ncbi:hypothetical protein B484DRAFT_69 [Ochromonadaceae sp. CCMP2298]|nr:hypothetical protein B484DRAFT_69 [Ochromonadaceae sp. CCMP2298]
MIVLYLPTDSSALLPCLAGGAGWCRRERLESGLDEPCADRRQLSRRVFGTSLLMANPSSPFFREYGEGEKGVSPLLADESQPLLRYNPTTAKATTQRTLPKPSKPLPLVYTDLKSAPAGAPAPQTPLANLNDAELGLSDRCERGKGEDAEVQVGKKMNRHSFVTNLEAMGSTSVWLVLLLPMLVTALFYSATVTWRYQTLTVSVPMPASASAGLATSEAGSFNTLRRFTLRRSIYQLGFVRSVLKIHGYNCQAGCRDLVVSIEALATGASGPTGESMGGPLLSDPLLSDPLLSVQFNPISYLEEFYLNTTGESVAYRGEVLLPLPLLSFDQPDVLRGTRGHAQYVQFVVTQHTQHQEHQDQEQSQEPGQRALWAWSTDSPKGNEMTAELELTTQRQSYLLTMAAVRILLSLATLAFLAYTVRRVCQQASKLREMFQREEAASPSRQGEYDYDMGERRELLRAVSIYEVILPEQYTAIFMLFFLFLWQGLFPAVLVLLDLWGVPLSQSALLACGMSTELAKFGLFFCLLVYLDGLKYNSHAASLSGRSALARARIPHRRASYDPFSKQAEKGVTFGERAQAPDSDADYWRRSSLGLSGSQFSRPSRRDRTFDEMKPTLSMFVSYHHPCSLDFLEFILWKLVALLLTWLLVALYWLLLFPHLTRTLSARSFLVVEGLLFACTLLWTYWVASAFYSTLRGQKRTKLLNSRFRHIAFRAIAFQIYFGLLALCCVLCWHLWHSPPFRHTHMDSSAAASFSLMWLEHFGALRRLVSCHPLSMHNDLLFPVSGVALSVAYCMQPPRPARASQAEVQPFVALNRELSRPEGESAARVAATSKALGRTLMDGEYAQFMSAYLGAVLRKRPRETFCLENALQLVDVCYQTYHHLDTTRRPKPRDARAYGAIPHAAPEGAGPSAPVQSKNPFDEHWVDEEPDTKPSGPRIKLSNLGLRLHSVFACEEATTFGFLAKSNNRLVVAFRGSVAGNAVSNLNVAQIPLPSLKRSRRYFTALMRRLESESDRCESDRCESGRGSDDEYAEVVDEADITFESDGIERSMERSMDRSEHEVMAEMEGAEGGAEAEGEGEGEEEFFAPQSDARTLSQIKNSAVVQQLCSVGQAIPLLNQGFARVHAGFWQSYLSIREDFMRSVVVAILTHLKEGVRKARQAQSLSPHASLYRHKDADSSFGAMLQAGLKHISLGEPRGHWPESSGDSSHAINSLPALDVSFCGHSLGAAIASLAALELASNLPALMEAFAMEQCFGVPKAHGMLALGGVLGPAPRLSLHMFGSPRIGNTVFAQRVAQKIETVYRVQVNGDLVSVT